MAGGANPPVRPPTVTNPAAGGPSLPVSAGWALMGKEPGSNNEYTVLRSGGEFFPRSGFEEILRRFTPGTPPPRSIEEPVRDALPWVTVSYAPHSAGPMLGIAVRTWSGQVDGARRPIAVTNYLCLPFADLATAPVSYAALYAAVREAKVAERSDGGPPASITLTRFDPDDVTASIGQFGLRLVATTAALLLSGPVAVIGAPADTPGEQAAERLRFLDAVAALLPYGQRSKLVTSTWADGGSAHRIRLAFTNRPRPGHSIVHWQRPDDLPALHGGGADYFQLLMELATRAGSVHEIVEHLAAAAVPHRVNDAGHAVRCLAGLDPMLYAVQGVRDGTASIEQYRWLLETDRIEELDPDDQSDTMLVLLAEAGPQDLGLVTRMWRRRIAENRVSDEQWRGLVHAVAATGQDLLWVHLPDPAAVGRLLDLADDLGFADQVLPALLDADEAQREAPRGGHPVDPRASTDQRCREAAALLLSQRQRGRLLAGRSTAITDRETLAVLTSHAPVRLAYEIIRQATEPFANGASTARDWLEWLETSRPLRNRLRPFRNVLNGEPTRATVTTVGKLGEPYVLALLRLARQAGPKPAAALLPPVLDWLLDTAPQIIRGRRTTVWIDELSSSDPQPDKAARLPVEAAIDLLLLTFGAQPRAPLAHRVTGTSGNGDRYVEMFDARFRQLCASPRAGGLPGRVLTQLAAHVAAQPWPTGPTAVAMLLRLLYEAVTVPELTDDKPAEQVARTVADFLTSRPDLADLTEATAWRTRIARRHPHLNQPDDPGKNDRRFPRLGTVTDQARFFGRRTGRE